MVILMNLLPNYTIEWKRLFKMLIICVVGNDSFKFVQKQLSILFKRLLENDNPDLCSGQIAFLPQTDIRLRTLIINLLKSE